MRPGKAYVEPGPYSCMLNGNFGLKLAHYLQANQWTLVQEPQDSDLIVYSGCAFSDGFEKQALRELQYLHKSVENTDRQVLVVATGCLPDITKKTKGKFCGKGFDEIHNGLSCFKDDMTKLDEAIGAKIPFDSLPFPHEYRRKPELLLNSLGNKRLRMKIYLIFRLRHLLRKLESRASTTAVGLPAWLYNTLGYRLIVPGQGCRNACSYCCIKFAKGGPKSVPLPVILDQVKGLLNRGVNRFLVFPDDLGSWGTDIGLHWTTLVKEIVSLDGDFQVALHNLGGADFVDAAGFFDEIVETGKISYLGIMLQHTNPETLKRMNRRPFDVNKLVDLWRRMARAGVAFHFHLIAGFPGETEEQFHDQLSFLSRIPPGVGDLMIFPYSRRKGTPAARKYADDELPKSIVTDRAARLAKAYGASTPGNPLARLLRWAQSASFLALGRTLADD